jgi:hypothetical protein
MQQQLRAAKGELLLALIFAALGILWIVVSLRMPLWHEFAPESGFLPLIFGVLLTGLSGIILADLLIAGGAAGPDGELRKPLLLLAALTVTVAGLEVVGFAAAIFLLLMFLYGVIERLPILTVTIVSASVTAGLYLVFKTWLGVPLPTGLIGY